MSSNPIIILAIESSCDDTSASVIKDGKILNNIIANQQVHEEYGGVVPELASREHHKEILPVIDAALKDSGVSRDELSAIAFTKGPGLLGSLMVGASFAKGLAWSLDLPLIGVNHMEAHVLAHFIDAPRPNLPFLCLTVSGGHTQLVLVKDVTDMVVIGTTRDDAAGEAFDKIGKFLGLTYPAGPHIDRLAQEGEFNIKFSKPNIEGLGFSFSGLKTAVMYHLRDAIKKDPNYIQHHLADICCSVQQTIVEILMHKVEKAAIQTGIKDIGIAGGVSANSELRKSFLAHRESHAWNVHIPEFQYCTDNAAMIAQAAHFKYLKGEFESLDVTPDPRLKIPSSESSIA